MILFEQQQKLIYSSLHWTTWHIVAKHIKWNETVGPYVESKLSFQYEKKNQWI